MFDRLLGLDEALGASAGGLAAAETTLATLADLEAAEVPRRIWAREVSVSDSFSSIRMISAMRSALSGSFGSKVAKLSGCLYAPGKSLGDMPSAIFRAS